MQSVQEPQSFQPPPLTTNYTPDMTSSQFRQAVADKFNAAKSAPLPKGIPADTRKASNAPIPEESTAPVAPPPPSDVWTGQSVQPPGGAVAPETPSDVWTGQSVQPPGGVYFAGKPTTPTTPVTGTAAKTGTQVPGVPDWLTNQVHPYGVGKLGMQREALENAQTTAAQNVLAERGGMEGLHTEKQLDIEAQQQQLAALQAKRDADFEEYKQKRAAADADAAKFHMDPDRYMKNKNVFAKILLAIAAGAQGVAMGAMKQAGPNPVVEQMDRDISRDMEAQKAEYEQKLRQGQNIDNLYSMALKHTGDEEQAMTMGHQLALQAVQAKMDGVQRRVEDADLKGKFEVAIKSATYQQSIDEAFVGIWIRIVDERVDLFNRGG